MVFRSTASPASSWVSSIIEVSASIPMRGIAALIEPADEAVLRAGTRTYLPDADGPALSLKSCMFTNTPDEHFIIDHLPDVPQVVVISPCSGHGFKFVSVVGEIAADLALEGTTEHDIEMFRLDRFAEAMS